MSESLQVKLRHVGYLLPSSWGKGGSTRDCLSQVLCVVELNVITGIHDEVLRDLTEGLMPHSVDTYRDTSFLQRKSAASSRRRLEKVLHARKHSPYLCLGP